MGKFFELYAKNHIIAPLVVVVFDEQAMDRLKNLLDAIDVSYLEVFFDSLEGVSGLGSRLFVSINLSVFSGQRSFSIVGYLVCIKSDHVCSLL